MTPADLVERLPPAARRRAAAEGERGLAWLADLPRIVAHLQARWGFSGADVLDGGSEALALAVTLPDGRRAVLKVAPPWSDLLGAERKVLEAAQGRGFAELYGIDEAASALLLERLGARLDHMGWSPDAEMAAICHVLVEVWKASPPPGLTNGAVKARGLAAFIEATDRELGRPMSPAVMARVQVFAQARAAAHDPNRAVLAHGDCHAANALQGADGEGFKFIDPDGLFIEPAYDLGILMREWSDDILAGDPKVRGAARCATLAQRTGVDATAIWQWGFLETVSTGLLCCKLEIDGWPLMLQIAEAWAAD